jgi:pimeloyl-ACP methyl ester carboxylesterase
MHLSHYFHPIIELVKETFKDFTEKIEFMEKVNFSNSRGLNLVGNYWEADSDAAIIMSHGFTGDKNERGYFDTVAEALNEAGYNVLPFDFSGRGESEDDPITVEKEVDDLDSAIDYLEENKDIGRIGLYGYSLGGLVSLRNERSKIKAIVLTSPITAEIEVLKTEYFDKDDTFTSRNGAYIKHKENEVRKELPIDDKISEEATKIDQDQLLSNIETPVQIIHGDQDTVVPLEDSQKAVEKLKTAKLEIIEGLNHSYDTHYDQIIEATENWFTQYMPP